MPFSSALMRRGEATPASDIDIIVFGGEQFIPRNIIAFAEDFRELTGRNADIFEIREVNHGTPFYETIMKEGIKIAWENLWISGILILHQGALIFLVFKNK